MGEGVFEASEPPEVCFGSGQTSRLVSQVLLRGVRKIGMEPLLDDLRGRL